MKWLNNRVRRTRTAIATYKEWRSEALELIQSEVGKGSWALQPVVKEIHALPYVTLKWLGGSKV